MYPRINRYRGVIRTSNLIGTFMNLHDYAGVHSEVEGLAAHSQGQEDV